MAFTNHKPAVRDIGAPGVWDTKNFFEYAAFDYTSCAGGTGAVAALINDALWLYYPIFY